ncbi:HesB/YadR/YfhF family protein [Fundicoccus sp. Sow4_H7]|uniref:HesB/YadR/YfhF family protein n=1 Tax=Fundicoccus sp. Sow4_H7 TaxID=3438784 RepID=UPI003F9246D6
MRYQVDLEVTDKVAQWFKEEVGIPEGAGIRIKTKIYASSPINQSYGLAIDSDFPTKPIASVEAENGLVFFIEDNDGWFFNGYGLRVELDEELNEPKYVYLKDGEVLN